MSRAPLPAQRRGAQLRGRLLDAGYRSVIRPTLFGVDGQDAEGAHERTLSLLAAVGAIRPLRAFTRAVAGSPRGPVRLAGIHFPGRVGLAAGVDKDGVAARAWPALGLGHVELGTVTAQPQPGNDRPRLFRLGESHAIINRMGFNNRGALALADRLHRLGVGRGNNALGVPVGVSIGKSKVTPLDHAIEDYLTSLRVLAPYADYLAVNVSSPNTPGLRSLQHATALRDLVTALVAEGTAIAGANGLGVRPVPIMVKIAPDLTLAALEELIAVCTDAGAAGLIATNSTVSRDGLAYADLDSARQAGGLSGAPLTRRSLEIVRQVCARTELPVIGVGGIMTADDARAMFDAGAALVQLYTGFIYAGPRLVHSINRLF
ncbi:MAG: quinone-dependent dihydroorotate dehydrogenase [Propionibacteriaceae bacterium]